MKYHIPYLNSLRKTKGPRESHPIYNEYFFKLLPLKDELKKELKEFFANKIQKWYLQIYYKPFNTYYKSLPYF